VETLVGEQETQGHIIFRSHQNACTTSRQHSGRNNRDRAESRPWLLNRNQTRCYFQGHRPHAGFGHAFDTSAGTAQGTGEIRDHGC
jgi:hypothetical protein